MPMVVVQSVQVRMTMKVVRRRAPGKKCTCHIEREGQARIAESVGRHESTVRSACPFLARRPTVYYCNIPRLWGILK